MVLSLIGEHMIKDEHLHIRINREEKSKAETLAKRFNCSVSMAVIDAIAFAYEMQEWMGLFIKRQSSNE